MKTEPRTPDGKTLSELTKERLEQVAEFILLNSATKEPRLFLKNVELSSDDVWRAEQLYRAACVFFVYKNPSYLFGILSKVIGYYVTSPHFFNQDHSLSEVEASAFFEVVEFLRDVHEQLPLELKMYNEFEAGY